MQKKLNEVQPQLWRFQLDLFLRKDCYTEKNVIHFASYENHDQVFKTYFIKLLLTQLSNIISIIKKTFLPEQNL